MKTNIYIQHFLTRAAMTLLVALCANLTTKAQYVAIYADPYSCGMVQVGTDIELEPFSDGASIAIADAGETVYFSYEPFSGYKFKGIRYNNLSSDEVTELPNGIYSFTMPSYTDELWVSIFIEFEAIPIEVTGVDINADNFPDENFRNWLLSQSYGDDAVITDDEMATITKIEARACKIQDLTGIEFFTELRELNVGNYVGASEENWNTITSLNLSSNTKLRKLWINDNNLNTLNISNNPDLRNLDVSNNALTGLDVTSNDKLYALYCNNNQLTELDVTYNPTLAVLSCYGNQLYEIDVTSNEALEQLFCENNQLSEIDVTNHEKLMLFNCNDNLLTALDLTGCSELYQLYCYNNQINGQAMDDLVNSLPYHYGYMVVVDLDSETEQNDITIEQADVAREKGWSVEALDDGDYVPYAIGEETHDYVDLDLPSGTLWATCNVGANRPQDAGYYFAWGETTGHGDDVTDGYWFDWENYQWSEPSGQELFFTKYCSNSSSGKDGFTDGKLVLDPEDDAAYVNWGSQWCTPTKEQLDELLNECTWTATSVGGVDGYEVKGSNGNTIFLPDTGWRLDDMLISGGAYWSRSANPKDAGGAFYLGFDEYGWYSFGGRCDGQCVRPVIRKVVELADNADNSDAIGEAVTSEGTCDVILNGRTITKNGDWNTICLPFSLTAEQLSRSPLAGADIRTLTNASVSGNHVSLTFGTEEEIHTGTPYLIRWGSGAPITNPVFTGVTINDTETTPLIFDNGHVNFIGYYNAFTVKPTDTPLIYYLTANNQLKYTAKERTLMAFRAYFTFTRNDGGDANDYTFSIDFGNGVDTITGLSAGIDTKEIWYTIDGRRINGKPMAKGVYVNQGHKVVIK